ncbi:DedA family protein [Cyanobacterium stanieri LEGE 03274]|uniref:DedA family protein n=1 Tax=Cyanobacterium stanieri LEGE 03274 TaxID=1828756 RepID=A0ABR9V7E3_9CHRO|nr:DedA family protein [Cyanobacterium stanieri]MBE9223827.1 DedA family protein [Cyanobacterium stanieri LEGE 03274]
MVMEFFSLEQMQELAQEYGYWAVFVGIALENTGIPLPGETITVIGGFLAGSGELNYWWVLVSAISGAVIGDNCGYWLGRIGGWSLFVKFARIFRLEETQLAIAKHKFNENAGKAIFFGRFVTLLRIFAGPIAGITEMNYGKFLFFNFTGATVWASVIVTLSYFVGRIIPLPDLVALIAKFGLFGLLVVGIWLGVTFLIKYYQQRKSFNN